METGSVTLIHSVPREHLDAVRRDGLRARSSFADLGLEMRRNAIYCRLRAEDDRMWGSDPDYVYVEVTLDTAHCRVADMDFVSLALMYLQGQGGRPRNPEAASLLARLYQQTSVPLAEYGEGMFSTPEAWCREAFLPAIPPHWQRKHPNHAGI